MRKKYCLRCGRASFSAVSSSNDKWICPYCQEDISKQPDYSIHEDTCLSGEKKVEEIRVGKAKSA